MSLAPSVKLILGNLLYDSHMSEVIVSLQMLPGVNSVRAVLPVGVEIEAVPGDEASLELDGGEGSQTVLTGKLRALRRGLPATEAMVSDAGADLSTFRPNVTYEQQGGGDVISSLANEVGVAVGAVDIDLPLPAYTAHQGRTAAEHVAYLAELGGAIAHIDSEGALQVTTRPEGQPDAALLYGREIITYEVRAQAAPAAQRVVVGSGPSGSADAPDALRPSASPLPGFPAPALLRGAGTGSAPAAGAGAVWKAAPALRTPAAATKATQAAESVSLARTQRVYARCFMLPALRPGMVVEVQELPEGLSGGPWLLIRVMHRLRPAWGGITVFEGVSAGAGSLLGSLLGAVGL